MGKTRQRDDGKISVRIGEYIKKRRKVIDITQNELGRRVGYGYGNFIAMVERGAAKFPLEKWTEYAHALQVPKEHWHRFLRLVIEDQHRDLLPYLVFKPADARSYIDFPPLDEEDAPVAPPDTESNTE